MYTTKTTQAGQPDRQTAPVANQPKENLVRLYVFYYKLFSIVNIFIL
jgi:hypothetical protein